MPKKVFVITGVARGVLASGYTKVIQITSKIIW